MEEKKALFIGRFQPFHKGHLNIINNFSEKYSKIIIGIGSSQYSNTKENPFSKTERKKMIDKTLKRNNVENYEIIEIPDIHNPPKWVNHVESIYSDFDVIITNNKLNQRLFSEKGYKVVNTKIYDRSNFSGKEIRQRMKNKTPWKHLVPESVAEVIEQIGGEQRIIDL